MAVCSPMGLVLTGGGARAAYQVGAIKALAQILSEVDRPFPVITGSSAGAINGAVLASGADDFAAASRRLEELWLALAPESVYRTDVPSLAGLGIRWMGMAGGGGSRLANHLLDTAPLRALLEREVPVERVPGHVQSGALTAFALTATNYLTGTAVSFFDGAPQLDSWVRSTRLGRRTPLRIDHVMASSAIPIFFPPVELEGVVFGDGCVRLTTPLSPAIHLGADRVIAISLRYQRSGEETAELNTLTSPGTLTLAEIAGVLLNSVFLDSVESDIERLERINRTLSLIPPARLTATPAALRRIPALLLCPSQDLGELATGLSPKFPGFLRYLLRGLGAKGARGSDLLSYLAFQRGYVEKLVDLGYRDTLGRTDEIESFARGPRALG